MVHITIDGLSGTGKSTVCKRLSRKLWILYVDPNNIVNAIALKCVQKSVNPTSENDVANLLQQTKVEFDFSPMGTAVKLDGVNVNNMLGHRMVAQSFSAVSSMACVKEYIAKMQEEIMKTTSAIIEGLDVGDVDINKIKYKFFLTADIEQRVQRKLAALKEKNIYDVTYEQMLNDTIESDNNSYVGEMSKIKLSQDIVMVNTTDKSVEEVVEEISKSIEV